MVVGGGISGLTAARDLAQRGYDVLVLEATDRVGGKLRRGEIAGVTVDVGAEAMVNRRPEAVGLAAELGIEVVHPTTATSRVWTRGGLHPLPRTLMGAPLDLDQLAASGVLSEEGIARARQEPGLAATDVAGDISVGDLVEQRYGAEVTDRLVEPLLGGVYAGRARAISAEAAMPQLLALARRGSITTQGAALSSPSTAESPVFAGIEGGMWQLPERLVDDLGGRVVRTGVTVRGVRRTDAGFEVDTGEALEAAAVVVLATPAAPTARLLADLAPAAAGELTAIDYASTAVVTLAFRASDAAAALDTGASGFLVPPVDGRRIKASTFSFAKWDWVRRAGGDLLLLRTSLGRIGEEQTLQVPDEELVTASLADLADATGLTATPVDAVVQRWGGGLPQYAVGHLDRVARIRAAVATVPGLAVCGAAYDGVGIAACIASAHRAVADVAG
ncbi:protoporphyrinogen oxidase [Nocardioides panacisoli]|uniref:Coproporphyrinogen III oxidase n=1 Tax=Nocardioides panacisoli TaxID=627624 RepID=A0ABP7I0F6_9ACTN